MRNPGPYGPKNTHAPRTISELFPRVGFIVTSLETDSRAVVRFYNKRGTAQVQPFCSA